MAHEPHFSLIGYEECRKDSDQTRLSGTIGAQQTIRLALSNCERNIVKSQGTGSPQEAAALTEALFEVTDLDSWKFHLITCKWLVENDALSKAFSFGD
jgi:hypothetical protein